MKSVTIAGSLALCAFASVAANALSLAENPTTPPPKAEKQGPKRWKDGSLDHEWLFWDNQDLMGQLGLGNK